MLSSFIAKAIENHFLFVNYKMVLHILGKFRNCGKIKRAPNVECLTQFRPAFFASQDRGGGGGGLEALTL